MHVFFDNTTRDFFGLAPLLPEWEKVNLEEYFVFFDGDTIKKIIYYNNVSHRYSEIDTFVETENRTWILPSAKNGKKHPLTGQKLMQKKHNGMFFRVELSSAKICLENRHNNLMIDIPLPKDIDSLEKLEKHIPILVQTAPNHWKETVDTIKACPRKSIRYKNGDVFRVALDWNTFAFGVIIGKFSEYRKWGIIPEDHPFTHIMTVPIVVRLFDFLTDNPNPKLETLEKIELQAPVIVMDDTVLRNTHPVVMHKDLQESDIIFPMFYDIMYLSSDLSSNSKGYLIRDNDHLQHLISLGCRPRLSLAWGFGRVTKTTEDLKSNLPPIDDYQNTSNTGIGMLYVRNVNGKPYRAYSDFSKYPARETVFKYFGIDPEISFDEFNMLYGGYTKKQYIDLLNKHKK